MGIESDQLVFDYLSQVGDLAHRTSMTAAERARLVSGLRGQIDRQRAAEGGAETKAAVRKILERLGSPEELVSGAGSSGRGTGGAAVPAQRGPSPVGPTAAAGASAPHLAGMDELGPEESDPDWWRLDPSPYGDGGGSRPFGEPVPGFVGGIEIPELLKPPPGDGGAARARTTVPLPRVTEDVAEPPPPRGRRRLWPRRVRADVAGLPRAGGIVEWVAAVVLLGAAFTGSLIALGVGWLAAWWSPRLSRTEAKWAAAGMPGLVAAGALVWLWGRTAGRWGEHIAAGGDGLRQAMTEAGPVLLRVAAVASALFLVWRARRPRL